MTQRTLVLDYSFRPSHLHIMLLIKIEEVFKESINLNYTSHRLKYFNVFFFKFRWEPLSVRIKSGQKQIKLKL
jgi:hypothetical protein